MSLSLPKILCISFVFCIMTAVASHAQTFTSLYSFCLQTNCPDGANPGAGVVQGHDGNFYGTTAGGGGGAGQNCLSYPNYGCGTVYRISLTGTLTTLYSFCLQPNCPDGFAPGALVQATDGALYGVTGAGGSNCSVGSGCGTVFKITSTGTLTTLHSFDDTDGQGPVGLIQASDGNFYGVTSYGGTGASCGFRRGVRHPFQDDFQWRTYHTLQLLSATRLR